MLALDAFDMLSTAFKDPVGNEVCHVVLHIKVLLLGYLRSSCLTFSLFVLVCLVCQHVIKHLSSETDKQSVPANRKVVQNRRFHAELMRDGHRRSAITLSVLNGAFEALDKGHMEVRFHVAQACLACWIPAQVSVTNRHDIILDR